MLSRSVPLSSTKLAKDKTHQACWPFAAHPNASRALAGGNDQIQRLCNLAGIAKGKRQCNGYELQRRIHMLCCLHSLGFPGLITHQTAEDQCTHGTS